MNSKKLTLTFEPRTIQHLGLQMYNQIPAALAELIANAYDADASVIRVKLYGKQDKKIIVEDDGHGMSWDDINDKFLKIGRDRREDNTGNKTPNGRFVSGKKGLGKLALFGVGETIEIETKSDGAEGAKFTLKWQDIKSSKGDYHPETDNPSLTSDSHGTIITISDLKRKTGFDQESVVNSIAKLFNYIDDSFSISVSVDDADPTTLNKESKFKDLDIQFKWEKEDFVFCEEEYEKKKEITGRIVTTVKPLKPGLRGVSLFANGRLVNLPEFYGNPDSSHFYSYTMGILNVNFIDETHGENDLIATNRQSLNWEHDDARKLKKYLKNLLKYIQNDWRKKRKEKSTNDAKPSPEFDYEKWYKTLPEDKRETIKDLLNTKMEDNDSASRADIVKTLHLIAPEYAEFHWRYFNRKINSDQSIYDAYRNKDYYKCVIQAFMVFISILRTMAVIENRKEYEVLAICFDPIKFENKNKKITEAERASKLKEAKIKFINPEINGFIFTELQTGYWHLSKGVQKAFRNILSHHNEDEVKEISAITERDCLDGLCLISHILNKIESIQNDQPNRHH